MGNTAKRRILKTAPGVEIRSLKSGQQSIRISFYYQGQQRRETLSKLPVTQTNLTYAARLRGEIINKIKRGQFKYQTYFPNSSYVKNLNDEEGLKTNVGELLEEFLQQSEASLEYSTYLGYKRICDNQLIPTFGQLQITELTPHRLRHWIRSLTVTSKTLINLMTPLRAIITQSLNDGSLEKDPLMGLVAAKLLDKTHRKSKFKVDPFNREEIQMILEVAEHEQLQCLFQFAFFTGLRTGELIALSWGDVNWDRNIVEVNKSVVRGRLKGTKTEAGKREVMLLPPAKEALLKQKAHTYQDRGRIFYCPSTHQPWRSDGHIHTAWKKTLQQTQVRYRNPYQTRHTYASMMLSAGENVGWLVTQMGHVDPQMVMRVYGKWIPDTDVQSGYQPSKKWENFL